MRRSVVAVLLFVLLALPASGANLRDWNFRVLLDGRPIGHHRFTLLERGAERELRSEADFRVRLLFLDAYRYEHAALERWRGDCLHSLSSRTRTNGEREEVRAGILGERLLVERPGGRDQHAGCVMSFAYWNPQILRARQLLNSQTGELVPVRITEQSEEVLDVRGRPVPARRVRLEAPSLSIDLWYAGEEWVALEAPAAGGRRLRYELM